jgi:hypothetical protein
VRLPGQADVAANLLDVRRRIERAGGDPDGLQIVAVTKGHPASACVAARKAGLAVVGENRVQEALAKMDEVQGVDWHLIGHLQRNKARHAPRFSLVQSVDSVELADAIARHARVPCLLQVNIAREAQKFGVAPEAAEEVALAVAERLELRGLMAVAPLGGDPVPGFRQLALLRLRVQDRLGTALPVLSMGMSGDFEAAVREGATMLRLGTVLFGRRTP